MDIIKINAMGKPLGRLASRVAFLLQGKASPTWRPERREGERILVYNTDSVHLSGKKAKQDVRYHHTSYPGGLKVKKVSDILAKDSRKLVWMAVYRMLPRNKLRGKIIKRLELLRTSSDAAK